MPGGPTTLVETGLVTSTTRGRTAQRTYLCKVTAGPAVGQELAIGGRAVSVGSQGNCDLVIKDPKVSRRHLILQVVPEGLKVQDLKSSNGTFVDGVRVSEAVTPTADRGAISVQLGDTVLRIRVATSPMVEPSKRDRFGGLVGESLAMREVFRVLELASPTEATVLIQGESGTGKELAARAIHDHSERAEGPFVVLDCSAVHGELLDSHLFGHLRGAFTGASTDRKGAFQRAEGGTLFLDEIGELPLPSQAKLLRAIEARTVQPLGSDQRVPVDTRLVAATNRDLLSMVDESAYRFDLFHRLSVVHVLIPPLRERSEDIPALVRSFYEGRGLDPGPLEGELMDRMRAYRWPGNVRELRNALERSWVLEGPQPFSELTLWIDAPGGTGTADGADISLPFKEAKLLATQAFERRYLSALMRKYDQDVALAADHAGINRRHFKKLLAEHGLLRL